MNIERTCVSTPTAVLTKQQLKALTSTDDYTALVHILLRLLLNCSLIFLLIQGSREDFYLGVLIVWIAYSAQFHFWGYAGIGHEFLHRRVFASRWLNDFFYQFCSSVTWNNAAMFRDTHMLHHRDTFSGEDTEAKSVQNWGTRDLFRYLFVDLNGMFRKMYFVGVNSLGRYPNLEPLDSSYANSARLTLAINFLVYSFFYGVFQDAILTLLLIISPFSFSLCNKVLAKSQHHELQKWREGGPLKFSRTIILPRFASFLYANMNYHAEHHFFPAVPFYNLPKLHGILKDGGHDSAQTFHAFIAGDFQSVFSESTKEEDILV